MTSLEEKVALVTGASRGIGAAVARALDSRGVHLGLASRSGDDLGIDHAVARRCDVRRPDDLEALAVQTAERFGGIDILVANAGVRRVRAVLPGRRRDRLRHRARADAGHAGACGDDVR